MNGIVLYALKYNDTSQIVTIYTAQHGRCAYIVPLSKRTGTRAAVFQPLSIVTYESDHRERATLQRLKNIKLSYVPQTFLTDPRKAAIVLFLAEFLYAALHEEECNEPLYSFLYHSIIWLDVSSGGFANFHIVFLVKLAAFLGFQPNVVHAVASHCFDIQSGCYCPAPPLHPYYIAPPASHLVALLARLNYRTMHLLTMNQTQRGVCLENILCYYKLHIDGMREVKSLAVLQTLFT